MIGLDTNVLIRYLTQDHEAQARKATLLIEMELSQESPGVIRVMTFDRKARSIGMSLL